MRRLVDGAYAIVAMPPRASEVFSILHPRRFTVAPEHHDELLALCHGVEDSAPRGPAFHALAAVGLADDGLPAADAAIMERLRLLGAGYQWHVRGTPNGTELTTLLRDHHSRRKLSNFEFGQTAVLPECGVARCAELTARVGRNKRVLVIGDDDLLAPVLARMGHTVTVLDIDDTLVSLLRRCAKDARVKLDARQQDILAPLPADLRGRFDAVLTDPMSYEACLEAFLARGLHALKPGGSIFCCVHPLARQTFARVMSRLPLHAEAGLLELSVYYYQGFVENWYRSDLFHLVHTGQPAPHAADRPLPFTNIIDGTLSDRLHGFTDIKCAPFRKTRTEDVQEVLEEVEARMGKDAVVARSSHSTDRYHHQWRALSVGGHLAVTLDKAKGHVSYDLFPYHPAWDHALVHAFNQRVKLGSVLQFSAFPPDLAAPTVAPVPRAAPTGKRASAPSRKAPSARAPSRKKPSANAKPASRGKR